MCWVVGTLLFSGGAHTWCPSLSAPLLTVTIDASAAVSSSSSVALSVSRLQLTRSGTFLLTGPTASLTAKQLNLATAATLNVTGVRQGTCEVKLSIVWQARLGYHHRRARHHTSTYARLIDVCGCSGAEWQLYAAVGPQQGVGLLQQRHPALRAECHAQLRGDAVEQGRHHPGRLPPHLLQQQAAQV